MKSVSSSILTVTQLNNQVKSHIESRFKNQWIQGEISSPKTYSSGHTYFTLKDSQSEISAVLFASSRKSLDFEISHGLNVIAFGKPSLFLRRGQYQFLINNMYPAGKGELWLSFEELKKRLNMEGLFDPDKKRDLPVFPRRIGVLTSGRGSVLSDIIQVAGRRAPHVAILFRPVLVQGISAAKDIRRGLKELNDYGNIDIIIVGRGGGSLEDLWCFNDEDLAREIFRSRIPVISAVGHETDFTIADFVADYRASTPSAAAEIAVPNTADLEQELDELERKLIFLIQHQYRNLISRIEKIENRYGFRQPGLLIKNLQGKIKDNEARLIYNTEIQIQKVRHNFEESQNRLKLASPESKITQTGNMISNLSEAVIQNTRQSLQDKRFLLDKLTARFVELDPRRIMKRGYSIVYNDQNKVITRSDEVDNNDPISIKLSLGKIDAFVVKDIQNE